MKLATLFLILIPLTSFAAKTRDFKGDWRVLNCKYHYKDRTSPVPMNEYEIAIDYLQETKSLVLDGQLSHWPTRIDGINGKGIVKKRKGECFDFKEEGIPLFKSCVTYTDIVDARIIGDTLIFRDILKESWVRPFSTTNGTIQEMKISKNKNMIKYSRFIKYHGSNKELQISCELERI